MVVAAAGLGRRLGDQGPKALVNLAGRPLLAWVLDDLEAAPSVGAVVVATHQQALQAVRELVAGHALPAGPADADPGRGDLNGAGPPSADRGRRRFAKVHAVVAGGTTRQQSVAAGLAALPPGLPYVAVHDAARPLAGPELLDRLVAALVTDPEGVAGVVPGAPVTDTIREVDQAGRSKGVVDRERLRAMQTPQVFHRAALERAHALARRDAIEATDEAALVERAGDPVHVLPASPTNLKVTTLLDLAVAEAILARRASADPGSTRD